MEAMHPDILSIVHSKEDLERAVTRVGAEITRDYADKNPLLVAVLRGAVVFMSDLLRAVKCPVGIDFMAVSSYGAGTKSSGVVRIKKDLDTTIEGRHVIVVEDILDTGITLNYLLKTLRLRNPASLEVAALTVKDVDGYTPPVTPRYVGLHVPDAFIVGYGLDYAERYRNLPYIGILKPEVYS